MRRFLAPLVAAVVVAPAMMFAVGSPAGPASAASCSGYVALTYDDGPTTATTSSLLSALKSAGARATFFIWGAHAAANPSLLKAESDAGMWIANHSYTHPHLTQGSEATMRDELTRTQQIIQQTIGKTPTLFRPPYGETNATLKSVESSLGLTEIIWSVDSQDWNGASTDQIVSAASGAAAGGIVLMHDGYQTTLSAVPRIVSGLAARGLCPGMIQPGTGKVVAPDGTTTTSSTTTTRATTTTTRSSTTTATTTSTRAVTSTTPTGTGGCTAAYTVASSWQGGFVASVSVTAGSTGTTSWKVTVNLPSGAAVSNAWNATNTGTTGAVVFANASYNGKLGSGQATSFGFQGTGAGSGATVSCVAS